jgi:hypothetical protein
MLAQIFLIALLSFPTYSLESSLESGDRLYRQRADETKAKQALEIYREFAEKNPMSSEAAWRRSMGCYFVGLRFEKNQDQREKLYAEGRESGRNAIRFAAKPCAECEFWTAINMALYGKEVGPIHTLVTLQEIEAHLRKSIAINPAYADGGAYRLLALIQQKLPGILGGSNQLAQNYYQHAIDAAPEAPLNYLFFSKFENEEFHDLNKANQILLTGLKVKEPAPEELEEKEAWVELHALSRKSEGVR